MKRHHIISVSCLTLYMVFLSYVISAGIIRGIDTERREVFINTPLPISIMQHINCLAGCISVPPALLQLNQGAPYVGENASLPTSREIRRGVFRMKPNVKFHKKPDKCQ